MTDLDNASYLDSYGEFYSLLNWLSNYISKRI